MPVLLMMGQKAYCITQLCFVYMLLLQKFYAAVFDQMRGV